MSPRMTDLPGHHQLHAAAATSPLRSPHGSGGGVGAGVIGEGGATVLTRTRRRTSKPLSTGFKSVAWTKPAAESLRAAPGAPATLRQQRLQGGHGLSPTQRPNAIVSPVNTRPRRSAVVVVRPAADIQAASPTAEGSGDPVGSPPVPPPRSVRDGNLAGIAASGNPTPVNQEAMFPSRKFNSAPEKRSAGAAGSGGSVGRRVRMEVPSSGPRDDSAILSTWREAPSTVPSWTQQPRSIPLDTMDDSLNSLPNDKPEDVREVRLERSLSDTSIVTASDFGGPPKPHAPIILSEISDEDAMAGLVSLCTKAKGLPVVKHAGSGGGKSRKLLRYDQDEGMLVFSGMRPPYFKTKIAAKDVDRADAKWCCVVVHIKGRSPLRLEVDSFSTASVLRAGLMAISKPQVKPKVETQPPPPPPTHTRQDSENSEFGLASVRPGHTASKIYDPDAALSVAALLAKEMEDERAALKGVGDGLSLSRRADSSPTDGSRLPTIIRGGSTEIPIAKTDKVPGAPTFKRSLSTSSIASSKVTDASASSKLNRQPLPQYGGSRTNDKKVDIVIDTEAALRRLRSATEGRGLMALKKNPNGKGRSRVMVRCRMEAGTIGWAHVLPPFSRKNMPAQDLIGATRSCRVVTLNFRGREPAMFETDRLTDALILEQGFVSLARLVNKNVT